MEGYYKTSIFIKQNNFNLYIILLNLLLFDSKFV